MGFAAARMPDFRAAPIYLETMLLLFARNVDALNECHNASSHVEVPTVAGLCVFAWRF